MLLARDLSTNTRLRLTGKDRVRFLNGVSTNDVARLAPGQGCHAAILNVKGRVVAELVVLADAEALHVHADPSLREKLPAALDRYLIADDVTIAEGAPAEAGLYGEEAAAALGIEELPLYHQVERDFGGGPVRVFAARDLRLPGFHLVGERAAVDVALARLRPDPLDDAHAEVLRVEGGVPRYGVDVTEEHLPTEARLDDAISYQKGCFLGQEVIVRLRDQGHLNWRLMGLRTSALAPRGTKLAAEGRPDAGTVTSSVVSPRLGPIALAYVHRTQWAPGTRLTWPAGEATVDDLPFSDRR